MNVVCAVAIISRSSEARHSQLISQNTIYVVPCVAGESLSHMN